MGSVGYEECPMRVCDDAGNEYCGYYDFGFLTCEQAIKNGMCEYEKELEEEYWDDEEYTDLMQFEEEREYGNNED